MRLNRISSLQGKEMEQKLIMTKMCQNRFAPVVSRIEELLETDAECIIAVIDGMSASGKSTLGFYLKELFDCNLFHMDDFFLQDYQRTEERLREIGGNVDYERFREEVLLPLLNRNRVQYRPFSCKTGQIGEGAEIPFRRLNIVEGSYSMHPYFETVYNSKAVCMLKVFTEISEELQAERIRKRNGELMLERFVSEWIPKENAYFKKLAIKEQGEMVV